MMEFRFALLFAFFGVSLAELSVGSTHFNKEEHEKPNHATKIHGELPEDKIYERLLEAKRLEQKGSVKYLIGLKDPEKQTLALKKLLSSIKDAITASKVKIDSNKNATDIRQLFFDTNLRDDVCTIVENTAFFAEFAVYFPDYVEKFFSKNNEFKAVYEWAYNFSKAMNLYEEATNEMMKIAGQELWILPRPKNYVNVNRIDVQRERVMLEAMEEMRRAKEEMKRKTASNSKQKRRKESKHNEL